jgi:hypothetical protein
MKKVPSAPLLLLLLLGGDFIFTLVHIIRHTIFQNTSIWVTRLTAYLNAYHLVKLFLVIVLLIYLLKSTRCTGYVSWILVFSYLLIDDALLIHQNLGSKFSAWFDAHFLHNLSLPPRFYEFTILAFAAMFLGIIVSWAYLHSSPTFRKISKDIFLFLLALVFFGVVVDLTVVFKLGTAVIYFFGFVEDSGEMVVFSLLLWYVYLLAIRNGELVLFLRDVLHMRKTSASS